MSVQRFQAILIFVLVASVCGLGYAMYVRNRDMSVMDQSIATLSDELRHTAKNQAQASLATAPTDAELKDARAKIAPCGTTDASGAADVAIRHNLIITYLETNAKFAKLVDSGFELVDACVDNSNDPRILFLAVQHLPNFKGVTAFGIMSEADPKAATIAVAEDKMNLVNEAFPADCSILGNGAAPDSQFLVTCAEGETATDDGFILDFKKSQTLAVYSCATAEDSCAAKDATLYSKNSTFFGDDVAKKMDTTQ